MKKIILLAMFYALNSYAAFKPLDPELSNYEYPFPVQFHSFSIHDVKYQMAYMVKEARGKKMGSILLLHGKNFSGAYWEKTAIDLSNLGFEIIIPDQIGFGKSDKPESFPYSLALLSKLTNEVTTKVGAKKLIVIGHSMGGMIATRFALMYPDLVTKLLLVNPIGLEDWKTMVPYKDVRELFQSELSSNETKIRAYQQNVYYAGKWKPEYDKGIEILVGWTLHKDYPRIAWNSALTTDMVFNQPVVYEFKNLKMPTLLVIGTRDRTAIGMNWAPKEIQERLGRYDLLGKEVVKTISNGKLIELANVGHMPQIEAYDDYITAIKNFIK